MASSLEEKEIIQDKQDVESVGNDEIQEISSGKASTEPSDNGKVMAQDEGAKDSTGDGISNSSFQSINPSLISSVDGGDIAVANKEGDEGSPTEGLAAPDSKDSLEVNLTSVCEDLSDNMSGKDESLEDIKYKAEVMDSTQGETVQTIMDQFENEEGKQHHSSDSSFEMVETTNTVEEVYIQGDNGSKQKDSSSSDEEEGLNIAADLRAKLHQIDSLPVQDSFDSVASQYSSEAVRAEFSRSSSSDEEGPDDSTDLPRKSSSDFAAFEPKSDQESSVSTRQEVTLLLCLIFITRDIFLQCQ